MCYCEFSNSIGWHSNYSKQQLMYYMFDIFLNLYIFYIGTDDPGLVQHSFIRSLQEQDVHL